MIKCLREKWLGCKIENTMFELDCISKFYLKNLDFICLPTNDEQVLRLILISLVCADVSARVSLVWKEAGIPAEKPRV